jgi:hypothetical protein
LPTLNQVGKTAKVFKQKNKLRSERLKLIMLMDHPTIKLRCDLLHQQNYTGADKIIAIMQGFGSKYDTTFQSWEITIEGRLWFCTAKQNTLQTRTEQTFFLLWEATEGKLVGQLRCFLLLIITEDVRSENPVEESLGGRLKKQIA